MPPSGGDEDAVASPKAMVLFDTRYGNTERVARALARGMGAAGVKVDCGSIASAEAASLAGFDFIAIGGPTHYRSASVRMREFLESLDQVDLSGKLGFAFDTRKESFWAGSAAKYIERRLRAKGVRMIWPTLSAWVFIPEGSAAPDGGIEKEELKELRRSQVILGDKMEELFEKTGGDIGKALLGASGPPA